MTTDALFPGPDPVPAAPLATAGQRLRDRQAARIRVGLHPLAHLVTNLLLHPDAHRVTEDDGHRTDLYRCGSCAHRRLVGGHAKSFPKCLHGYSRTPIPEAEQRMNGPKYRITTPRVTSGAGTDVAAWWPGCITWTPKPTEGITTP